MAVWRRTSAKKRTSLIKLEHERFAKSVRRFVAVKAPQRAGLAVKKLGLELTRSLIYLTPAVTSRARGGWLPFSRSIGERIGVSGSGVEEGVKKGTFTAKLTGTKPTVTMTNSVRYIMPLEIGSRPHVIRARNAKALRFVGHDGMYMFRRQVRHPGTQPYLPLYRSMRHIRRFLEKAFEGFTADTEA